jgi:hypothetical protein
MGDTPFETIESAHDYVRLLREQVLSVEAEVVEGIGVAVEERATRRVDALRLVDYKLKQLDHHLGASSRILNDLRALRLLLTGERREPATSGLLRSSRTEPVGSRLDG